jgi:vitamin B12 transporter
MNTTTPSRSAAARRLLTLACAALAAAWAHAQTAPAALPPADDSDPKNGHDDVVLEPYVVSASRSPQDPKYTSSSVTVFDNADLALSQITDLKTALSQQPGLNIKNTGALGGPSEVYFRGMGEKQNIFLVDGIRMNTRASSADFLNAADLSSNDRIEVLRGPQSVLYGSSAMGGVTRIDTAIGCGQPTGAVSATAGSFDTRGSAGHVQGGTQKLSYSASVSALETANDRPKNEFSRSGYTTRLQYSLSDAFYFGGTLRDQRAGYQNQGSLFSPPSPGDSDVVSRLGTVYADWHPSEVFRSRLTAAMHHRGYDYKPVDPTKAASITSNNREVFDWQNTWLANDRLEVTGGLTHELAEHTVNNSTRVADPTTAEFVNFLGRPVDTLALTLGGRHEELGNAGDAKTWKAGAAWQAVSATKLRANYGTGFSAPSESELMGVPSWRTIANPDLIPEQSRGWDVGIDQELIPKAMSASVTYFQSQVSNMIEFQTLTTTPFTGRYVNISRAELSGVELAVKNTYNPVFSSRLAYTYLEAIDGGNGKRLAHRPRNVVDAELRAQVTKPALVGVGFHGVQGRTYNTAGAGIEDYTTLRLFGSYEVRRNLFLKARVENALDEKYSDTRGYPSLPAAAYGSVEWWF